MDGVCYREGYKYQIHEDYTVEINIKPEKDIDTKYIQLNTDGKLTIKDGYAWDGPSGPTVDTLNFMRGSLVHDALYQLMREEKLSRSYKGKADRLLIRMCRQDGMSWIRTRWVYEGVRLFSDFATDPANKKPHIGAPKGHDCIHLKK